MNHQTPVPAVISVVLRESQIVLVKRANPPDAGTWGFPGGKIELGEALEDAAVREVKEETGLDVRADGVLTCLDAFDIGPDGDIRFHYVLVAVLCEWIAGEPEPADDALDADWFSTDALPWDGLALSKDVAEVANLALKTVRSRKTAIFSQH